MTDDAWQTHTTHEAAKEPGEWLEARGSLHQPIQALTTAELDALAQKAISRFIVLPSQRIAQRPDESGSQKLSKLLTG